MQNEPNPNTATTKCAKRTQFLRLTSLPHDPNMRNEPNLSHAHHPPTQKYETNPISAVADLWRTKMRNEPNLPRATIRRPKNYETNPIYRPALSFRLSPLSRATARAAQFTIPLVPIALCLYFAKRTQFTPALSFRLSTLYFLLSRGQRPAPRATKLHKSSCARRKDFCVSSYNRQAHGPRGRRCDFF